jgi:ABC-type glutathione transport system ATPase component
MLEDETALMTWSIPPQNRDGKTFEAEAKALPSHRKHYLDYEGEIIMNSKQEGSSPVQAVFQDPSGALNPVMRVGWILEEPLRVHRLGDKKEREKKVDQMLDLVGLDASYKKRKPGELSSGQKQRISIGCALMLNPSLIIADEPVSALDVSVGAQILNLFRDLNKRLGLSLLFISHNLNLVYYLCDRISVMKQGRIVEQGTAEEVYANPKDGYTRELLAAAPDEAAPQITGKTPTEFRKDL